ncbi:MAG TPA: N-acetylmuramoyl-L-alanine amidase [Candidatus Rokubacteria bacterium]|nr:N-acetylmuramoyl-L-alanine amidase [Candidatus Rokubacteria bacterium]
MSGGILVNHPEYIVIHCSDSTWGDAREIDAWHKARGFDRIGYHHVILGGFRSYREMKDGDPNPCDDGRIEEGRKESDPGAHCAPHGMNFKSVGVCLIGSRGFFTPRQMEALRALISRLRLKYGIPASKVVGHCEQDPKKPHCPGLDMAGLRKSLAL